MQVQEEGKVIFNSLGTACIKTYMFLTKLPSQIFTLNVHHLHFQFSFQLTAVNTE